MPVSLHEMMEGLSPERHARIRRRADRIIEASRTMSELRRALDVTQEAVARRLGITQASLSEIETRGDAKISTLKRVVEAMGAKLHVYVEMPGGTRVPLAFPASRGPKAVVRSLRPLTRSSRAADVPKTQTRSAKTR
jgi:transcriptional regulator with XRE-family HTH domain